MSFVSRICGMCKRPTPSLLVVKNQDGHGVGVVGPCCHEEATRMVIWTQALQAQPSSPQGTTWPEDGPTWVEG